MAFDPVEEFLECEAEDNLEFSAELASVDDPDSRSLMQTSSELIRLRVPWGRCSLMMDRTALMLADSWELPVADLALIRPTPTPLLFLMIESLGS